MQNKVKKWMKQKRVLAALILLIIVAIVIIYNQYKPLPEGISYEGSVHFVDDVDFIYDLSYKDLNGKYQQEQEIFETMFQAIDEAEEFLVLDMFLFNGYYDEKTKFPKLSQTLTQKIITQKQKKPNLKVVFVTDEVNTNYNAYKSKEIEQLKENGVEVIITNLDKLRDPTPVYSGFYRAYLQWFGESGTGWIPNPMAAEAPKVTVRSYLRLLNIKANHRKLLATEKEALITSANPHDASGFHSNIAFSVKGNIIGDFVKAEQAVADYSNGSKDFPVYHQKQAEQGDVAVQFLTEGKITKHVLQAIQESRKGDQIWIGMFYIADRDVVTSLTEAAQRGVSINMVLDPNQNAFGSEKIGLPNLPVAAEFEKLDNEHIQIRWYNTTKEQYHTKLMLINKKQTNSSLIIGGSANYTSRNLNDYNLEANLKISAPADAEVSQEVNDYFDRIWENRDGHYTVDYKEYQDKLPVFKYIMYRIQKLIGVTTY